MDQVQYYSRPPSTMYAIEEETNQPDLIQNLADENSPPVENTRFKWLQRNSMLVRLSHHFE